ncbi:MAG: AMP-binding protein [Methylococcales symbiont of Hymedesmia sp. n. MRB-2018]|nr:MAG: AMP-binding protein [Methylococcales symbiont of Hymedesmia sp. n. MRB-2018]
MRDKLIPLSLCGIKSQTNTAIAFYQGNYIDTDTFCNDVANKVQQLTLQDKSGYGLFYEEAYPFTVMLYALLHAGKEVWIAGNNKQATAEKLISQDCLLLGDWQGLETFLDKKTENSLPLSELDLDTIQLIIFTSGSSGEPKAIKKTLSQLQNEVEILEQKWGDQLKQSQVLATVSHQHIYGLLFRVLWPLFAGRVFHSAMYLSPESLLKASISQPSCWVSSPAQQKRLDDFSPWDEINKLNAIFSSGGSLSPEIAKHTFSKSKQSIVEIYGSSETGGIAWRESIVEPRWTLFNGVSIEIMGHKHLLKSPYIPVSPAYFLDDKIKLDSDGLFTLEGRLDRIVKVEEKRLSLDELEQALCQFSQITEAYCQIQTDGRNRIMASIALTPDGRLSIEQQGRASFIKNLRVQLMKRFETVVLPRKWLILDQLPLTSQGKLNRPLMTGLLSLDNKRYPQLQFCCYQEQNVELLLRIQPELIFFDGHFPEQPILAGIAQLAWVEKYGRLFFSIDLPFLRMEVIKFKKIIHPKDIISLKITWNNTTEKLYFKITSENEVNASGRLLYGEEK